MGDSTLVALAIFALFFVYITARGRLPLYLAALFGPVTQAGTVAGSAGTGAGGGGSAANAAGQAAKLVQNVIPLFSGGSPVSGDFGGGGSLPDVLGA